MAPESISGGFQGPELFRKLACEAAPTLEPVPPAGGASGSVFV